MLEPINELIQTIAAVEAMAASIVRNDDRIPLDRLTAVREALASARFQAEASAVNTGVEVRSDGDDTVRVLQSLRSAWSPPVDPYEGWIDWGVQIDGAEIQMRSSPADAERLAAALTKVVAPPDSLSDRLKRAQLALLEAKLARVRAA